MTEKEYFTLDAYREILETALECGYRFIRFDELSKSDEYQIILRHDIDYSPSRALNMALIEKEMGISSIYFLLLHAEAYSFFDPKRTEIFRKILKFGHEIGLHFDVPYQKKYGTADIKQDILTELSILERSFSIRPKVFAYHNPTKEIISQEIEIEGYINAYSRNYFKDVYYLSDSNQRLGPKFIITTLKNLKHRKIQLLVHPLLWNKNHMNVNQCINMHLREKILEVFEFEDKLIGGLNKVYLK